MLPCRLIVRDHSRLNFGARRPISTRRSLYQQFPFWNLLFVLCALRVSALRSLSPSFNVQPSNLQTRQRFFTCPFSFDTLANCFALEKNSTLFFSSKSELLAQKHPGGGGTAKPRFLLAPRFARSLFSRSCELQISQLVSFDIHANWWGGGGGHILQAKNFSLFASILTSVHFYFIPSHLSCVIPAMSCAGLALRRSAAIFASSAATK
jgi:hypothetical protein